MDELFSSMQHQITNVSIVIEGGTVCSKRSKRLGLNYVMLLLNDAALRLKCNAWCLAQTAYVQGASDPSEGGRYSGSRSGMSADSPPPPGTGFAWLMGPSRARPAATRRS